MIAEQNHDDSGLVWPAAVTPYDVHVVVAGKNEEITTGGAALAAELDGRRPARPARRPQGLAGRQVRRRGAHRRADDRRGGPRLATGVIEVKDRRSGERVEVPVDDVVGELTR